MGHNDAMAILVELRRGNAVAKKNENASSSSGAQQPIDVMVRMQEDRHQAQLLQMQSFQAQQQATLMAFMAQMAAPHVAAAAQQAPLVQGQELPFPGASLFDDPTFRRTTMRDDVSAEHKKLLHTEGVKLKRCIENTCEIA